MSSAGTADERSAAAPASREPPHHGTLVIGLGNPLRGDDGVGWRVVDVLREELASRPRTPTPATSVELDQLAVGGLTLMERLVGAERAILVDALCTGQVAPGTVTCSPLADVRTRRSAHLDSAHDAPLPAALEAGRALGAALPADLTVVGIEISPDDRFSDGLSTPVAAAVPRAAEIVVALLAEA